MANAVVFFLLLSSYWYGVADRRKSELAKDRKPTVDNSQVKGVAAKRRAIMLQLSFTTLFVFPQIVSALKNYGGVTLPGDISVVAETKVQVAMLLLRYMTDSQALMIAVGAVIRWSAMNTLGAFFTRALVVTKDQRVVDTGLYSKIRHPGYLANLVVLFPYILEVSENWIVTLGLMALYLVVWSDRMNLEEDMMKEQLGEDYKKYMKKVAYRMIPFVY